MPTQRDKNSGIGAITSTMLTLPDQEEKTHKLFSAEGNTGSYTCWKDDMASFCFAHKMHQEK